MRAAVTYRSQPDLHGAPPATLEAFEQWRTYRLCKLLHCTPTQLDAESAADLDWLLAIDGMVSEIQEEESKR